MFYIKITKALRRDDKQSNNSPDNEGRVVQNQTLIAPYPDLLLMEKATVRLVLILCLFWRAKKPAHPPYLTIK